MTDSLQIRTSLRPHGHETILTPEALAFVKALHDRFAGSIAKLLAEREKVQKRFDAGEHPSFLSPTSEAKQGDWKVASLSEDLQTRTVEITGPVERKMIINALNSGADVFMADFEDSNAPTYENVIAGQFNLFEAVRRTLTFQHPSKPKLYKLNDNTATLMVRPRGLHLSEAHLTVGDAAIPASLVDFGLFFFHNARELVSRGSGPYFYLPKLQSHLEARLWNDIFVFAQKSLEVPVGTIKATVLLETLPAAFEMEEILFELRDHSAGLNCGRWDYIFSYIKTFRNSAEHVIPDRDQVGMTQPNMSAYTDLLIQTCHRRGAFAMGGMAAQIPIKNDPKANQTALDKVRVDKSREAKNGHDGSWVAHPGLVQIAREAFAEFTTDKNQLGVLREDVKVSAEDLIRTPTGTRTDAGLRKNIRVGIQYLEAWLGGQGCVPLYNLMEDAATAEISRTQIWQWIKHGVKTDDGHAVTEERVRTATDNELTKLRDTLGAERFDSGHFQRARDLFLEVATNTDSFADFLTLPAYEDLIRR